MQKAEEKTKTNQNGSELPRAKDFKLPKSLTKDQKELIEATREAMKALKEEEAKYGKKTYLQYFRFSDYATRIVHYVSKCH